MQTVKWTYLFVLVEKSSVLCSSPYSNSGVVDMLMLLAAKVGKIKGEIMMKTSSTATIIISFER